MVSLSAVIITYNEERNIERCLIALQGIADEIVVLDSHSTDRTKEICARYNVRFFEQSFLGHIEQKNKALEFATYPHVLSLDADEVLSDELRQSIIKVKENWEHDGYTFNRLTSYCGHWVKHCGWYPDKKLRLFVKSNGKWAGKNPHDRYFLDEGSTQSHLKGDLLHYSYHSISQHIDQVQKFSSIGAHDRFSKGKSAGIWTLIIKPIWRFIRQYILQLGFLDGFYGFQICAISAFANFLKYAKARELICNKEI